MSIRFAIPLKGTVLGALVLALSLGSSVARAQDSAKAKAPALTDANIAAIVLAANTADIENGKQALSKAQSPDVKQFAQTMITDHTSVNQQAGELAAKLKLTPAENDASRGLTSGADKSRQERAALSGKAYDKAYIDNEVTYHQSVLDTIDKVLVPNTQNAELKALLVKVRPAFVAHLEHAKKVQASLA